MTPPSSPDAPASNPSTVARIVRGAQSITLDHYAAIVAALNSTSSDDVGRSLVIEMHAHAMRGAIHEDGHPRTTRVVDDDDDLESIS
jgi:hypothetical protein